MNLRMTEQELVDWEISRGRRVPTQTNPKKKSKYGNKFVYVDGIRFDSQKEAKRYSELNLLKRQGTVHNFLRQVPFDLPGNVRYFLDFLVWWADGHVSYEDTKGFRTPVFIIKKKLVEALFPVTIEER